MSETKLLPCPNPWCGASTPTVLSPDMFADTWCVECHVCKVRAPECDTEELAIAAWNTRSPDPRIEAAKGLADALKKIEASQPKFSTSAMIARAALEAWEKLQ